MKKPHRQNNKNLPMVPPSGSGEISICGATSQSGEQWINVTERNSSAWVKRAEFSGTGSAAIRSLSELGVHVIGAKRARDLVEMVSDIEHFPTRIFIEQPGWTGGHFALQNGEVFSPEDSDAPEVLFARDLVKCASAGALEGWQEGVACPLTKQPIPAFFIMAGFAAPVLAVLARAENFGFELVGEGGIGKTTIQKLMASVVGPPATSPQGYLIAMDATRVGLSAEMRRHSDLPMVIDEAMSFAPGESSRARGVKLREIGMKLGLGHETRKEGRPDPGRFRFVFVISTNEGIRDLTLGESASQNDAASDRLIPLHFDEGRPFGVFHRKPKGFEGTRSFALSLERASQQHHGTAIRVFLRRLVQDRHTNGDALLAGLERRAEEFCASVGVHPNDGSEGRVAQAFGIVMAAGLLAQRYGVLAPEFRCERSALACYRLYAQAREPDASFMDQLKAIARSSEPRILKKGPLANLTNAQLDKTGVFLNSNPKKQTELLFWPSYFQARFPNYAQLIRLPDVIGKMNRDVDRPTTKRTIRANYTNERVYCFVVS